MTTAKKVKRGTRILKRQTVRHGRGVRHLAARGVSRDSRCCTWKRQRYRAVVWTPPSTAHHHAFYGEPPPPPPLRIALLLADDIALNTHQQKKGRQVRRRGETCPAQFRPPVARRHGVTRGWRNIFCLEAAAGMSVCQEDTAAVEWTCAASYAIKPSTATCLTVHTTTAGTQTLNSCFRRSFFVVQSNARKLIR